VAKSTDVKIGKRTDVGNVTIKYEMIVKSDAVVNRMTVECNLSGI